MNSIRSVEIENLELFFVGGESSETCAHCAEIFYPGAQLFRTEDGFVLCPKCAESEFPELVQLIY